MLQGAPARAAVPALLEGVPAKFEQEVTITGRQRPRQRGLSTQPLEVNMRMTQLSQVAFVGLLFTFSGCGDNPLAAPGDVSLEATAAVVPAELGVLHSVTGSGQIAMFYGEAWRGHVMFTARILADGRVKGQVNYFDQEGSNFISGEVFDLKVDGNMAKIFYRVERGGFLAPGFEDFPYAFFTVVDNGEGGSASLDMISWVVPANEDGFFGTSLQEFIDMSPAGLVEWLEANGWVPGLFAYINGNIQVH